MGQFAESLGVSCDGDPAVGQVEVVQGEASDGGGAGGVDGGQGDDQPLCRGDGDLLGGEHLGVGHRQEAPLDFLGFEAGGGVGEDQPALLGEAEQ
ncbi:hypothetical protein [Streptomyces sp. TRM68367]|uniref:hypothetical protein n=1 Tax=Streptomyces sp. TRM68367 TaxID=2758415 RepID=UPI001CA80BBA|nr:hypothetical protein [Streptomyces sp. TRM68367]